MVTVPVIASAASSGTSLSVISVSSLLSSDGSTSITLTTANAKGALITGSGIAAGTYVVSISSTTLTLSQSASVPSGATLAIATPLLSSASIYGNSTVPVPTGAVTQSGTSVTLTTTGSHNLKVGQSVVIAGTASSTFTTNTSVYNGTFTVTAVPSATTFTVTNPFSPSTNISTAGTVTSQSSQVELTLTAKSPGAWGNSLYYEISNSTASTGYPGKYFNLAIYSGGTATGNIVERFSDLTMLSTDSSYAINVINAGSNYVVASDSNAANHTNATFSTSGANTPLTTNLVVLNATGGTAGSSSTSLTLTSTAPAISVGMYVYGNGITNGTTVSSYNTGTYVVGLSSAMTVNNGTAITFVNSPFTGGADGTTVNNTAIAATTALAKLDSVSQPLLLNAPGVTELTNVNNLLNYAYNRGDVFVIIDPTQTTLDVTSQLALTNTYTGGSGGSAALGFGAVYYPNLTIPTPNSSTPGSTVTAYPGGAIAAKYVTTDASRGVFKSPAGLEARLSGVVAVASLTNTELDYLNNGTVNPNTFSNATPVNAIRYIPGAGIVVMGARTLNSSYATRYVSVRRSLIYLRKVLSDSTAFALFETNDQRLWNRLQTTCEAILISFWQSGGLKGNTALDAFYVKSDSSINTAQTIALGEVHLEIGVALQRPAEFVVIRISQYDSGSVVTVL
jgi:hypothetical protein